MGKIAVAVNEISDVWRQANEVLNILLEDKVEPKKSAYGFVLFERDNDNDPFVKKMPDRCFELRRVWKKDGYVPRVSQIIKVIKVVANCFNHVSKEVIESMLHHLETTMMEEDKRS